MNLASKSWKYLIPSHFLKTLISYYKPGLVSDKVAEQKMLGDLAIPCHLNKIFTLLAKVALCYVSLMLC